MYQSQDIKILENLFLTTSIEMEENTFSALIQISYLCLDLLSWWVMEWTAHHAPTRRSPSVPLHSYLHVSFISLYTL